MRVMRGSRFTILVPRTELGWLGLALALGACQPRGPSTPEPPVAEASEPAPRQGDAALDDLGEPRGHVDPEDSLDRSPSEVASVDGVPVEHIDMDGADPNGAPTEMVSAPPERTPSGSLLDPGLLAGPKG